MLLNFQFGLHFSTLVFCFSASSDEPLKFKDMDNVDVNGITMNNLKSMVDLRPQVYDDFSMVFEKYPYDNYLTQILWTVVSELIYDLGLPDPAF